MFLLPTSDRVFTAPSFNNQHAVGGTDAALLLNPAALRLVNITGRMQAQAGRPLELRGLPRSTNEIQERYLA